MDSEELTIKAYLEELHRRCGGDTEVQVSMHEVGEAIGLDKAEAGSLAEQLMVQGLTELRTLAGGISITQEGMAELGLSPPPTNNSDISLQLSSGPVATDADRQLVHQLTLEIKEQLSSIKLDYKLLEEFVIDLKTIEVQMLSPKPKISILRELFRSLQTTSKEANLGEIATRLNCLTN